MKKWIAAVLAALMMLTLVGCGCIGKSEGKQKPDREQNTPAPEPAVSPEPTLEPTASPEPAPEPEPTAVPADPAALVGAWQTVAVTADGHALTEREIRSYMFDLAVELREDGTGTVTLLSDPGFREEIAFNGHTVTYRDLEIPYTLDGDAITVDYLLNGLAFTVRLERAPEIPAADPQALVGIWKTAQVAAGSYVLSADEIRSYGFDLVIRLNEDGTGEVSSPSDPRFREEIVFNGRTVTYTGADVPFLYTDDVITLDWSMNGVVFTVTLERAPEQPETAPVEASDALVNAFRKTQEAQSMHADLIIDIVMHVGVALLNVNEEIRIRGDFALDQQKDPRIDRIEGTMTSAGMTQNFLTYSETVDDTVYTYASEDGGKTWEQSTGSASGLTVPSSVLDQWAAFQKTVAQSGTETVNGKETVVYTGTLSAEFLTQAGGALLSNLEGYAAEDLLNDLDDIVFTVNTDSETGCISRLRLDLTDAVETLMRRVMDRQLGSYAQFVTIECTVSSGLIEYTVSQINEVPEIVIPVEARAQRSVGPTGPAEPAEPEEPAKEDGIVGEWALYGGADRNSQEYVDFMLALGIDMTIIFNADGTGGLYITIDGESEIGPFTYTLKDDKLIINGTATPVSIDGDFLTVEVDGRPIVFRRK